MSKLAHIPFHGTRIVAAKDGETVRVALRPICDALGLNFDGQRRRLERRSWAAVVMTTMVGADGKARDMLTVDRRTFTMWLATIDTSRVKSEQARDLIGIYQREAADALDRYFHEGAAINAHATEHQLNAAIRRAQMQMELCQAAKGIIHPDHLEARARIVLARGLDERPVLDEARKPLYTQDFLREKNLSAKRLRSVAGVFGKRAKAAYIERYGVAPEKYHLNLSNGQVREVFGYTEADRPILDAVWETFENAPRLEVLA